MDSTSEAAGKSLSASTQPWIGVVSDLDLRVYTKAGYGHPQGLPRRPVLLVIDVNYRFVGREPLPIEEAVAVTRTSCGNYAWSAIDGIKRVIDWARGQRVPIVYSTSPEVPGLDAIRTWGSKNTRVAEDVASPGDDTEIVMEISPAPGDTILRKRRPSVFFDTPLREILDHLGADGIICTGGTTSGCVRASAVDGFSFGYGVAVVSDATFDRSDFMHRVSLFDVEAKYGTVLTSSELITWRAEWGGEDH